MCRGDNWGELTNDGELEELCTVVVDEDENGLGHMGIVLVVSSKSLSSSCWSLVVVISGSPAIIPVSDLSEGGSRLVTLSRSTQKVSCFRFYR